MDDFYHTKSWKKKRQYILKRDHYECQDCKRYGKRTEAEMVHHIIPYELNPKLGLKNSNLISLCNACHNKRHPEKNYHRVSPPRKRF